MSYDSDVVSATSGRGEDGDWDKIIKLCDRIRESFGSAAMGSALSAVMRRIKHTDFNIQCQALTLLEACVSNCGKDFELELTKSSFHSQAKEIITSRTIDQRTVHRFKTLLATWATDYKNNPQMNGYISFVDQISREGLLVVQGGARGGVNFAQPSVYSSVSPPQRTQEDDDLQKAIRMSLEEATQSSNNSTVSYPNISGVTNNNSTSNTSGTSASTSINKFNVRAIYDFEAVEDNELSFKAGELITVIDNSDDNWWRGTTQLGTGLFPANFVTPDLTASPEPVRGGNTSEQTQKVTEKGKVIKVNETQVDLLLDMLKTADITSDNSEELNTLNGLEEECKAMKPIAENNITGYQKQLDDMNEVSQKLQESLARYRKLLQEKPRLAHKVTPPTQQEGPPPYQYTNNNDYYAPPPPDITGTFNGMYQGGYVPPYAPPTSYVPQHGVPPTSYAPPPSHGAPPTSYVVPPTHEDTISYTQHYYQETPSYYPATVAMEIPPRTSPQIMHHQMTTPTNNTMWQQQAPPTGSNVTYQPLL